MGCMVGHDTVDGTVLETFPQRILVLCIADWWIHEGSNSEFIDIILVKREMLCADFGGDEVTFV